MPGSPVIILTGASRGLGLAIAQRLLSHYGARLVTLQRTITADLAQLSEQYPDRVVNVSGDVAKPEDNAKAVHAAIESFGQLNGLVLNAGSLSPMGKLSDVPLDALVPSVQANLLAALYLVQPALPHLRAAAAAAQPSRVVFVSSGASSTGYQAWGMYSMNKAGLNSFARTLAAEERASNVAFYAVRPGVVDTDMQVAIRTDGPAVMEPTQMAKFESLHRDGKLLPPAAPGSVIAGLAVEGKHDWSGEYVDWADERFKQWQA